jgi:cardiolipin synthase
MLAQALYFYREIRDATLTDNWHKKEHLRSEVPDTETPLPQGLNVVGPKASIIGDKVRSLTPREQIYNVPNILTATRLVAAPFVGYLVLHEQHTWALALFAYAGITDLVDGWIARKYKLQTVVGSVIDPMADKFLMTILTVTLSMNGLLPGG